jgi:hypothetical protein
MRKEFIQFQDDDNCDSIYNKKLEPIEFVDGCMWEDFVWHIEFNKFIEGGSCKHCIDEHIHVRTRYTDDPNNTYETRGSICPRIVVALNEGGYNSTGVCLDCILEAAAKIDAPK